MTLSGGQLENNICQLYTHYGESSESLEGDCDRDRVRLFSLVTSFQEGLEGDRGRNRVQRCRLFSIISTSFQEGPYQKLFFQGFFQNSASKIANCILVDIVNYLTGFCRILATRSRSISIHGS